MLLRTGLAGSKPGGAEAAWCLGPQPRWPTDGAGPADTYRLHHFLAQHGTRLRGEELIPASFGDAADTESLRTGVSSAGSGRAGPLSTTRGSLPSGSRSVRACQVRTRPCRTSFVSRASTTCSKLNWLLSVRGPRRRPGGAPDPRHGDPEAGPENGQLAVSGPARYLRSGGRSGVRGPA